jgi:hypothetical protein
MAEAKKKDAPAYGKGDRVAITGGRKGLGVRGDIFWVGENKYGPGWRYGLKGDDGETYWLDEANVGDEKGAPPPPEGSQPSTEEFEKGDRVRIRAGDDKGVVGSVFWVGESKFGKGMRYGIRGDDEETYWADQAQVEASDEPAPEGQASARNEFSDDAPLPEDPGAFEAPPPEDDDFVGAPSDDAGDPGDIPF